MHKKNTRVGKYVPIYPYDILLRRFYFIFLFYRVRNAKIRRTTLSFSAPEAEVPRIFICIRNINSYVIIILYPIYHNDNNNNISCDMYCGVSRDENIDDN